MSKRLGMFFLVVALAASQSVLGWGKQDNQKPSASGTTTEDMDKAVAVLNPTSSSGASGKVSFTRTDDGVRIVADLQGLTPGRHTLQISRAGDCSEIDRSSGTQGSMGTSGTMGSGTTTGSGTYGGTSGGTTGSGTYGGTSGGTTTDETYGGTTPSDTDRTGTTTDRTGTGTTGDMSTSRTGSTYGSNTGTGISSGFMNRILTADSNGKAYMEWTDSSAALTGSNALVGAAVVVYAMDRTSGGTGTGTQGTPGMGSSGTTGSSGSGTSTGTGSTGSGTTGSGSTGGYGSEGSSSTGTYGGTTTDTSRMGTGTTGTTRSGSTTGSMGMGSGMLVACGMIESEDE